MILFSIALILNFGKHYFCLFWSGIIASNKNDRRFLVSNLKLRFKNYKFCFFFFNAGSILSIIPVLNVDKEIGYYGRVSEKNVIVDLVPHLEIKNIDQISMLLLTLSTC